MTGHGITAVLQGTVRVVTVGRPASTALIPAVRQGLIDALAVADGARAVLIRAEGGAFGAALSLEPDLALPRLGDVCAAVQGCPLPVVMALQGLVAGAAAELALAAPARVAGPSVRLALPDIGLGLPPLAGATQRLPHLIGPARALQMLITGRTVLADEALAIGLVDQVVEGDPTEAALTLATDLASGRRLTRPIADPKAWQAAVVAARREERGGLPAVGRIVECVEAALLLPLENGLAMEAVARADLEGTPEVAGLRWAAKAERRAAVLPPAVAQIPPGTVQRIGLLGTGGDMVTLASLAIGRGLAVVWEDADQVALAKGRAQVEGFLDGDLRLVSRTRLVTGRDPAMLGGVGLLIHATAPDRDALLHSLPGAPHLVLNGPPGALGLRLAPAGRVCELALPGSADPEEVATAVATLRQIGLVPVLVGRQPVLGSDLATAGAAALARLAALGVPRRMIAATLEAFGARLPVMKWPDPPATLRAMTQAEVCDRWLGAMANAGLRALEAGIARRPSDVDHLLVAGYGFPRWHGGPMHQADQRGLLVLRRDLRRWAEDDAIWAPAALLDRLIADGVRLSSLDV
jgi:3-hydroxyacyl-CoA dehydrogenase